MILNFSQLKKKDQYLTKEEILERIDQKIIYEYYLGQKLNFKSNIKSPFRKDNNPSFQFYCRNGVIYGKDWGTGESFNCFDFVQKKYSLSFSECIKVIINDFNLNNDNGNIYVNTGDSSRDSFRNSYYCGIEDTRKNEKTRTVFQVRGQPFTISDIQYWSQFRISLENLSEYQIISCKYLWKNEKLLKFYTKDNPVYAYKFTDKEGNISYKIYSPLAEKKYKWLFSGKKDDIEGFDQLPWFGDLLIITKSLKDVICLKNLGFAAISLQGECNTLSEEFYNSLNKRFSEIIVFYDNDETGILNSNKMAERFGIKQIFVPKELKSKDISEVIRDHGFDYAQSLINSLI